MQVARVQVEMLLHEVLEVLEPVMRHDDPWELTEIVLIVRAEAPGQHLDIIVAREATKLIEVPLLGVVVTEVALQRQEVEVRHQEHQHIVVQDPEREVLALHEVRERISRIGVLLLEAVVTDLQEAEVRLVEVVVTAALEVVQEVLAEATEVQVAVLDHQVPVALLEEAVDHPVVVVAEEDNSSHTKNHSRTFLI